MIQKRNWNEMFLLQKDIQIQIQLYCKILLTNQKIWKKVNRSPHGTPVKSQAPSNLGNPNPILLTQQDIIAQALKKKFAKYHSPSRQQHVSTPTSEDAEWEKENEFVFTN